MSRNNAFFFTMLRSLLFGVFGAGYFSIHPVVRTYQSRFLIQGIEDWEAVLHKTKEMFIKCPPHELIQRAPAYIKEPLRAGG